MANKLKARQRPTKVQQRAEKIEQILDAAEYLFSKHGLYGVTLKDVAKRVGAHHTLLNYYFVGVNTAICLALKSPTMGASHSVRAAPWTTSTAMIASQTAMPRRIRKPRASTNTSRQASRWF